MASIQDLKESRQLLQKRQKAIARLGRKLSQIRSDLIGVTQQLDVISTDLGFDIKREFDGSDRVSAVSLSLDNAVKEYNAIINDMRDANGDIDHTSNVLTGVINGLP